jgi:hypothetical protein
VADETARPPSALVNEALRQSLAEDAGDLAVIEGAGQRVEHVVRGIRQGSQAAWETIAVHFKRSEAKYTRLSWPR